MNILRQESIQRRRDATLARFLYGALRDAFWLGWMLFLVWLLTGAF